MNDYSAYEIVMIVHELHQRGYEQLRLFPGMSPSGMCWRWAVYPKALMKNNDFEHHGDNVPFDCPFGSTGNAKPIDGQKLLTADDFMKEFPSLAKLAEGKDPEYVKWYQSIVEHARNYDFPIAFAEYFDEEEWAFGSGEKLPYPPF